MTYNIRAASLDDAVTLAPLLREADKNEIAAMSGMSPLDALDYSIRDSVEVWFVSRPDGHPLALYGVGVDQVGGIPWMVGTDEMRRYGKSLVKQGRLWVHSKIEQYGMLYNYVDARNTVHIEWLTAIGFTVVPHDEYIGHDKSVPFLPFYRSY
jgi:hypothetical protein